MKNKYLNFITDEHLLTCIGNLHNAYLKAKNNITKKNFYSNKVDTIKLTFDAKFNDIDEEKLIQSEILRQIDKSINNSIGTFHEQILGGIKGYEAGNLSGYDIKATDDSLFAIFGSEDVTQNIADAVFEKLANTARIFLKAKLFYVLLDDYSDTNEKWIIGHEEYSVSQKRVFKISIKQFYAEVTKDEKAYECLCETIPMAIEDCLTNQQPS
ncbi:MAG: Eco47II family restriction endonuclease [Bacteroidetes bacterium]|nr:Eco47II family restriction endonuclease [Bacteroidota bacterium]